MTSGLHGVFGKKEPWVKMSPAWVVTGHVGAHDNGKAQGVVWVPASHCVLQAEVILK